MALRFNGIEIPTTGDVRFGGGSFSEVRFNGVTFWKKGGDGGIAPPEPSFCDASDDLNGYILVRWGYSGLDVGYLVYRSDAQDGTYSVVAQVTNGDLFYEDFDVIAGQTYWYYAIACSLETELCSGASEKDSGEALDDTVTEDPPTGTPQNLQATNGSWSDKINVTWENGSENNATGVNVYRDSILIDSVPFGSVVYSDTSVDPNSSYGYTLAFFNQYGEGPISASVTGSTSSAPDCYTPCAHDHAPADIVPQGSGSGLDADKVDGKHASSFASSSHTHSCSQVSDVPCGSWTFNGTTLSITIH